MSWYLKVLNQYADFKGRASREEFWMFFLFHLLATFVLAAIGLGVMFLMNNIGAILLPCLYLYAVLIPNLAVTFRRLHDTGRSAWFLLVGLIPLVGGIWLLIVLIKKGDPEENIYGKNPIATRQTVYHRKRSAAVALIIASVFWFVSSASVFIVQFSFNYNTILSLFLPVFLIITGFWLFSKRKFSVGVANSLILLSIVWLIQFFVTIRESYSLLIASFNLPLLINLLTITIPIALLLSGIYILQRVSDRTVPASLLFVGSIIWILSITIRVFFGGIDISTLTLPQLVGTTEIVVPVSLIVFARTLLSKEKFTKEVEKIMPVPDPIKNSVVIQPANKSVQPVPTTGNVQPANKPVQPMPVTGKVLPVKKPVQSTPITGKVLPANKPIQPVDKPVQPVDKPIQPPDKPVQPADKPIQPVDKSIQPVDKPIQPAPIAVKVMDEEKPVQPDPIKENDIPEEKNQKVVFLREDKDNTNIWVVYQAPSKADATDFLSTQNITRPAYYVVVETPEGNFGKDKDGLYQE